MDRVARREERKEKSEVTGKCTALIVTGRGVTVCKVCKSPSVWVCWEAQIGL